MRRWHGLLWGALGLALVGCEDPQIVTATPPGGSINRIPEDEKGDKGPQALGETARAQKKAPAAANLPPARATPKGETFTTPTGLKYETLKEGTGDEVKTGQTVVMTYVGKLDDDTVFDQTDAKKPFETQIGTGQVIPGWDQGIVGMRVGERRKLIIPGDLAYGASGRPPKIGPNARLTFEVELLQIK